MAPALAFSTLFRSSGEEARAVHVVERDGRPVFHVLGERRWLAALAVSDQGEVDQVPPAASVPESLGEAERWVVSSDGVQLGRTSYSGGPDGVQFVERLADGSTLSLPGSWDVSLSADGSSAVFLDGHREDPAQRLVVMQFDGGGTYELTAHSLQSLVLSADASVAALVELDGLMVFRNGREVFREQPVSFLGLDRDGRWLAYSDGDRVRARSLSPGSPVEMAFAYRGRMVAALFTPENVLVLVTTTTVGLFDLARRADPVDIVARAGPGELFVSAAFREVAPDGPSLFAVAARKKLSPQLAVPDRQRPPLAIGRVVVGDTEGALLDEHVFDFRSWFGVQPELQWTPEGRLLAHTRDHVVLTRRLYP